MKSLQKVREDKMIRRNKERKKIGAKRTVEEGQNKKGRKKKHYIKKEREI